MSHRERALKKLFIELEKDIILSTDHAKNCRVTELLYFVYLFHWIRLLDQFENAKKFSDQLISVYSSSIEESLRYLISIIAKHCQWGVPAINSKQKNSLKLPLVQFLLKHANNINSKYETESYLKLFDVTVSGERDQHVKIDIAKAMSDAETKNYFNYFLRVEIDNKIKTDRKLNYEILLRNFKNEYLPFSDLFEKEMGVTVDEFCKFTEFLISKVQKCFKEKEEFLERLSNGNIDIASADNFHQLSQCFVFSKKSIYKDIGNQYRRTLNRLTFSPEAFDERQLRFHHITRKPLIVKGDLIIISPEMILDSLFTNTHYTLIESEENKDTYMSRQSSLYIDNLIGIAIKYGYHEVDREIDLYEGKKQIGDIDLVLKNDSGHYLLIEAKNHALPLDVYFKDLQKTKKHLTYLQNNWEKKVMRRVRHLKDSHLRYSIPVNYVYLIVSRFPEIISHFSELLILSTYEFNEWLSESQKQIDFSSFFEDKYENRSPSLTVEELNQMQKDSILFGKFTK